MIPASSKLTREELIALDQRRTAECYARFTQIPGKAVADMEAAFRKDEERHASALASMALDESKPRESGDAWKDSQRRFLAWLNDNGHIETTAEGLEISDEDRRFAHSAEGEFLALAKEKTGDTAPDEKLIEWRKANATLLAQTHAIAEKAATAGLDCYRATPFGLYRYFIHSRHVEKLPCFRRMMFLPYMAQQIRAPMVAALEYFLATKPFARMWVMSSGPRVPLCDVNERAKFLHGKISDLNASQFMRAAGVEIVFRSTELGTPEFNSNGHQVDGGEIETDENGQMYFNVHSHLIVVQKNFIQPDAWKKLLQDVGNFWRGTDGKKMWWKDGSEDERGRHRSGRLVDAREVCKYITKPGEILKLTGDQIVALQEQLSRLKLMQPMGALAVQIKEREEKNLRLIRKRTPDGPVLREAKNWNRHNRRTATEKAQDYVEKLERKGIEAGDLMRVVARSMPTFGPSGVSEPTVTVMASRWNETAVRKHGLVDRLIRATWEEYAAGRAIRVHTCTSTVLETRPFPFVADLPPPRIPLSGAELAGYSR